MADIVDKYKLEADTSEAEGKVKAWGSSLEASFAKGVIGAQLLTRAFTAATGAIRFSITEALNAEKAQLALANAFRVSGDATGAGAENMAALATHLQDVTGYTDEAIKAAASYALNIGVTQDKVSEFVKASIVLANVTGDDVTTAMRQLTGTLDGTAGRLAKVVPELSKLTKEQLTAGDAAEVVTRKLGDLIGQKKEGASGGLLGAWNIASDLAEAFGRIAINAASASSELKRVSTDLQNAAKVASKMLDEGQTGLALFAMLGAGNERRAAMAEALRKEAEADAKAAETAMALAEKIKTRQQEASGVIKFGESEAAPIVADKGAAAKRAKEVADREQDAINEKIRVNQEMWAFLGEVEVDAKQEQDARAEFWAEKERQRDEILTQAASDNAQRKIDVLNAAAERETEIRERAKEEEDRINKERERGAQMTNQAIANSYRMAATVGLDVTLDALEMMLAGQKINAQEMLASTLRQIGGTMRARGLNNVLEGMAMNFRVPGSGAGLMGVGATQIAIGTSLGAAGRSMQGSGSGMGGGGGGGRDSGGSDFRTRSRNTRRDSEGDESDRQITIVVKGPMSPAEVGQWVQRSLNAAAQQGRI
jgi:hypothetical protein